MFGKKLEVVLETDKSTNKTTLTAQSTERANEIAFGKARADGKFVKYEDEEITEYVTPNRIITVTSKNKLTDTFNSLNKEL